MTGVAVFGSTGAIGRQALEVIEHLPGRFRVSALVAHRNVDLLARQARRCHPEFAVVAKQEYCGRLRQALAGTRVKALAGPDGMDRAVRARKTGIVVMGLSGTLGLHPTLTALKQGKRVALATKEIIVSFGSVVMAVARRHGTEILPVDSELSAVLQCLRGEQPRAVARVVLTASGGPFLRRPDLSRVTVRQALGHPVWSMGRKITVDSATLMNKGLEAIETARYFDLSADQIEVMIHPQSIVHSLVEFTDGSVLAQLALPDMRLPIQYALTFPERLPGLVRTVDLSRVRALAFERPDSRRFPGLGLAFKALRQGGVMPCVLNAANEQAVQAFLAGRIRFSQIPQVVARTLNDFGTPFPSSAIRNPQSALPLSCLLRAEASAHERAERICVEFFSRTSSKS